MQTPSSVSPAASSAAIASVLKPAAPANPAPTLRQQVFQCLTVGVFALASYIFISHYLLQSVQIVGVSMAPTLKHSGYYLLNRCVYLMREPQPEDIVVIRDPLDQTFSVKRIVARAGDSVYLKGGHVYVNGRQLLEPYLEPGTPTFTIGQQEELSLRCREGEYFLLGDNRGNSTDSRVYGAVPRQNILGAVIH
ncbi:MAG: signal peptidase I [Pedosphaera sp.]|nr:signal peptidase I [Pedosphaera sp.]